MVLKSLISSHSYRTNLTKTETHPSVFNHILSDKYKYLVNMREIINNLCHLLRFPNEFRGMAKPFG